MKRFFLLLTIVISSIFFTNSAIAGENFVIENYDISINVDENRKAHVKEEISFYFTKKTKQIKEKIPKLYSIRNFEENSFIYEYPKISNIKVNDKFSVKNNLQYTVLEIDKSKKAIHDRKKYVIEYDYDFGNDKFKGKDEFGFNLISFRAWNCDINNIYFHITLPKYFDKEKVMAELIKWKYKSGRYGGYKLAGKENLYFTVSGKTIDGYINKIKRNENSVQIRIELPDKYFNFTKISILDRLIYSLLILILTIISFSVWNKYGKEKLHPSVVSFDLPKNLSCAEAGHIFNEHLNATKMTMAMIIDLANKGYIEVEEDENDLTHRNFIFCKVKEYDGEDIFEKKIMDIFFEEKIEMPLKEVTRSFWWKCDGLNDEVRKFVKDKFFEKLLSSKNSLMLLIIVSVCFLSVFTAMGSKTFTGNGLGAFIFVLFPLIFSFYKHKSVCIFSIIFFIWSLHFFVDVSVLGMYEYEIYMPFMIFDIICYGIVAFCYCNISKRNEKGNSLYQELLGFKKFEETVEKNRQNVEEATDLKQFYKNLPYLYVLDIKNFPKKQEFFPDWLKGNLTDNSFNKFLANFYDVFYSCGKKDEKK